MFTLKESDSRSELLVTEKEPKRYTYRQLNTQAKAVFRRIQISRPDGGSKGDYRYRGWELFVNNGHVSQLLKYDVVTLESTLKRSRIIILVES
jgi:hypothetical protein